MSQRPHLRVLSGTDPSQPEPAATEPAATGPAAAGQSTGATGQSASATGPAANTPAHSPADERRLRADIEAVLLAAEEPITFAQLAAVADSDTAAVQSACAALANEYHTQQRGFEIAHIAGGVRLQTAAESVAVVQRFVAKSNSARLSAAAMETLAVVAYKQPVSRAQITAIRGVNADAVVRSLCERGYLIESGRDPGPGNAALLKTTDLFLTQLGINSLADLPSLADLELDAEMMERLEAANSV